jgi:hypothetical protein
MLMNAQVRMRPRPRADLAGRPLESSGAADFVIPFDDLDVEAARASKMITAAASALFRIDVIFFTGDGDTAMKAVLISSAAFAALILTSVAADARGFRGGGGGFRGGGGFHAGGFRGGGVRGGGYRGGMAGYRGGYGRGGRYGYAGAGRYGYARVGRYGYGYGYRPGYGLAAAGVGAAAAAGYYGSTYGGCGPNAYYDSYAGGCRPY